MTSLKQIQELCTTMIEQIEEVTTATKVNKAAHTRLRNNLNQIKKLVTPAKTESLELTKK
jgi:hypothetical protein